MALQMDLGRKPSPAEWLAGDAWFDGFMRDVMGAYREGYQDAKAFTELRFGGAKPQGGPQVKGKR